MPAKKDIPGLLIDAAMELATEKRWHDVTMIDIATKAGISVAQCHEHCNGKADLLRQCVKRIDQSVLADLDHEDFNEPGHDRLIAVIMARFDALADHRDGLRAILSDNGDLGPVDMARAIKTHFGSMRWMLEAAGFRTGGLQGSLRVTGLGAIYARAFHHWLDDDTSDFGPTMAFIDRELSRAGQWDTKVENGLGKIGNLRTKLSERCKGFSKKPTPEAPENTHTSTDGATPETPA
ncbi:TetR family transcriptional regulator [Thalassospira sp. MA62]|nr:TetR family transcriptional regulator [Thalassospira sp. MA62]